MSDWLAGIRSGSVHSGELAGGLGTEYWLTTPFLRFKLKCQIVKTFKQTEYVNRRIPFYYYSKNFPTIQQSPSWVLERQDETKSVFSLMVYFEPGYGNQINSHLRDFLRGNFPNLISISISFSFQLCPTLCPVFVFINTTRESARNLQNH